MTLDPDVQALIDRAMATRGLTFKQALNDAVRRGLTSGSERPQVRTPTFRMGTPTVDLDRALALASDLEDDEIRRELDAGR